MQPYLKVNVLGADCYVRIAIDGTGENISVEEFREELDKNRSSRKMDSLLENRSSGSPILLKEVSENQFSGKTYFYAIAPRSKFPAITKLAVAVFVAALALASLLLLLAVGFVCVRVCCGSGRANNNAKDEG